MHLYYISGELQGKIKSEVMGWITIATNIYNDVDYDHR